MINSAKPEARARHLALLAGAWALFAVSGGCAPRDGRIAVPGAPLVRSGDEIMVCGQLFHTGTPVILWLDQFGYDAYRVENRFDYEKPQPASAPARDQKDAVARYGSWRKHVPDDVMLRVKRDGWSLDELRRYVDQFVLHYDVCGTSKQCFKVLHDHRHLSVHFMLDLDGTIYQTLDLKERAWHAGHGNDRSIGIEIANIGAYAFKESGGTLEMPRELSKWYGRDSAGRPYVTLPASLGGGGIRTPDFVAYPARSEPVIGEIHGSKLVQFDLTSQQYDALIKLTATLCRVLPAIALEFPRDAAGRVRMDELSRAEYDSFRGILGHYHLTRQKIDPGPAFDWERLRVGVAREFQRPGFVDPASAVAKK